MIKQTILIFVIVFSTLNLTCVSNQVKTSNESTQNQSLNESSINSFVKEKEDCGIDFENFTYSFPFDTLEKVTLTDGILQPTRSSDGLIDEMGFRLSTVSYGDLTGDNREEAIVVLSVTTGGSSMPRIVFVYEILDNKAKFLWKYNAGDRADEGLRNVYAEKNKLVLETYEHSGKGDCCPETYTKSIYEWRAGDFKLTDKQTNLPNPSNNASYLGRSSPCQ